MMVGCGERTMVKQPCSACMPEAGKMAEISMEHTDGASTFTITSPGYVEKPKPPKKPKRVWLYVLWYAIMLALLAAVVYKFWRALR